MINGGQINGGMINGGYGSILIGELVAMLENTGALIAGEHLPNARHVTDVTTAGATAVPVPVMVPELTAYSEGVTETFYNPQQELLMDAVVELSAVPAFVTEMQLLLTGDIVSEDRILMAEWLRASAEADTQLDVQRLAEQILSGAVVDSSRSAFARILQELATTTLISEQVAAAKVMETVSAELLAESTLLVEINELLEGEAGDSVEALGTYFANVSDMAGAWLVFKVSGEVVQGWVMNVEGDRPFSQYDAFDFNSMANIGGSYFAATDGGLYMLGGDTDEGAQIDARLSSMMLDFDTTAQKRVVAAYLGYTSSGTVVLKVRSVDDGRLVEHWYEATEVTADAPREGFRPLGRGLKSRYWQFEIANVDGSDFEIDKLELQPIKLRRRV